MSESRTIISRDNAKPPFFVGIDLGGQSIKIGIVDDNAQTIDYTTVDTFPKDKNGNLIPVKDPAADAMKRTSDAIYSGLRRAGLHSSDVVRVGLVTPGTQDIPAGKLVDPANLPGWENFCIRDELSECSKFPVSYDNDANAAAFGERWMGSGKGYDNMILLTLGTGLGCGIIINGNTYIGQNSHGGECGHNIVDPSDNARICNCGQRGHLEAYASATGLARRIYECLLTKISTSLKDSFKKRYGKEDKNFNVNTFIENMDAETKAHLPKMLYEEALTGDAFSIEMIEATAKWLGIGIVTLMHTLDPHCVLIGGAMTFGGKGDRIGEMFLQRVRKEINARAYKILSDRLVLEFASLGGDAGYLGAAGVARSDYKHGN
ncbi:MAG: ROK family protein [Planctomycetaceae bacterium]|jgi:glucokinase|nr:ROK family protein [Planctomycetaceae bacterium]